jgi:acetyl esterase/lipase
MLNKNSALFLLLSLTFLPSQVLLAQLSDRASWTATVQNDFRVIPNITYQQANGIELKIDVYQSRDNDGPAPTFIYYHGGGWVGGSKEANVLRILPYLEQGWSAVNVQYRLGNVSLAPAAVEDSLCALRWVARNAEEYGFDKDRLVVSGNSAGGHLALVTGMLPADSDLGRQCLGSESPKVAAIVNWYGITDVADLLDGENQKSYAVRWMSSMPDRNEIAARISPLNFVNSELPPIITIHGDADPTVPYDGGHGGFPAYEMLRIYGRIFQFLNENVTH